MKRAFALLSVTALMCACATPSRFLPPAAPAPITTSQAIPIDQLARIDAVLFAERDLLRLAPDLARVKWNDKTPIVDRAADEQRIVDALGDATRVQADPTLVRDTLRALNEASNFAQNELHKQWREQKRPPMQTLTRTPAQIQASYNEIVQRLLAALAQLPTALRVPGAYGVVDQRAAEAMPSVSSLAEPVRRIAIKPLLDRASR